MVHKGGGSTRHGVADPGSNGIFKEIEASAAGEEEPDLEVKQWDGNSRAHIQEKRTLPRASDVIRSLRKVAGWDGDQAVTGSTDRQELEFARVEIQGLVGRGPQTGKAWVWTSLRLGCPATPLLVDGWPRQWPD